jgi:hypothetical protein
VNAWANSIGSIEFDQAFLSIPSTLEREAAMGILCCFQSQSWKGRHEGGGGYHPAGGVASSSAASTGHSGRRAGGERIIKHNNSSVNNSNLMDLVNEIVGDSGICLA